MATNKTTKADYKYFKDRVSYWQKELGQTNWSIYFTHVKLNEMFAETGMHNESHVAKVTLNSDWGEDEVTNNQLNKTAFHEVMHLVMSNLVSEATARYAVEYDINRAEHEIIRTLENLVIGGNR